MAQEITGKIKKFFPATSGESQKGHWDKQQFMITTEGNYPKDVGFDAWNQKVDLLKSLKVGQTITVHYNPESREYNDKLSTNLAVWKIEVATDAPMQQSAPAPNAGAVAAQSVNQTPVAPVAQVSELPDTADDDIPF